MIDKTMHDVLLQPMAIALAHELAGRLARYMVPRWTLRRLLELTIERVDEIDEFDRQQLNSRPGVHVRTTTNEADHEGRKS